MEDSKELTLEEKQEILFDILKDIDRFCRDNNIKYSISDGTMLGAIRHGGFIPWDDDADICMLREDFDKFAATYKSDKYHLLFNTCNDDEFFYAGYIKINDPNTYVVNHFNRSKFGVTVDIFPLEDVPEDNKERKKFMHGIRSISNRLYHRHKTDLLSRIKAYRYTADEWWEKLNDATHKGNYTDSPLVGQALGIKTDHVVFPRKWFDNLIDIPFNGYNFLGFADYHPYLEVLFGSDYMTPKKWAHYYTICRK